MMAEGLLELIKRLEKATGPNRGLDNAILVPRIAFPCPARGAARSAAPLMRDLRGCMRL
jgi:hypothetical protein